MLTIDFIGFRLYVCDFMQVSESLGAE
jgi:hypothetical protein